MRFEPDHKFDVDSESKKLKKLVSKYSPDTFVSDLASLIPYIGVGRIEIQPFVGLDSPLKQLSYLASLNLTSPMKEITEKEVVSDEDWKEIIAQTISAKAGYYDLLLPASADDPIEYHRFYKLALPVFMDYYNTGGLNYEEQVIDKILGIFKLFDTELLSAFSLTTEDFINIYNAIDQVLNDNLNKFFQMSREVEVKQYLDDQERLKRHPREFDYDGNNPNIKKMIAFFQGRGERLKINIEDVYAIYNSDKVDRFFQIFTIKRDQADYFYYTQKSPILQKPIFELQDGRYLIFEIKQIIYAIYNLLDDYLSNKDNKLDDRYFKQRGKYLHYKTLAIFDKFFKKEAHIYSEYRVQPNGDGQDLLLLHKGRALIIEIKSGYEAKPHSVPKSARKVFEGIYLNFKRNIQKGFEQTQRIMNLFLNGNDFDIYNEKNQFQYRVQSKRYPDVFSIIVTADKFRRAQIDLSHQLKVGTDDIYPWSVNIDDLEIILLTLKKLKKGPTDLIRYLYYREELQGRLDCDDELELWGAFINSKSFKVPEDEQMHFRTFPEMAVFYDDLYESGLGFDNEKRIELKKDKRRFSFDPGKRLMETMRKKK